MSQCVGQKISGQFTQVAKQGAMFVLGSGRESPQLHNPDYDFPDELTPVGRAIFFSLIERINGFWVLHSNVLMIKRSDFVHASSVNIGN
ncbi:hypothetical protein P4S64_14105 [Vibrio sp. M60_M31a]